MGEYNTNVFKRGHFQSWNDKFGSNFTDNFSEMHKQMMIEKNMETGGAYQASVSGLYGEFTIAAVFKSLPEEYHVLNNVLIQTGTQYRLYQPQLYGESPWRLVRRKGKVYEEVKKSSQIDHIIVSPYGLFIIETKNHKGMVFGDVNGRVWTQVLQGDAGWRAYGGHSHYTFFNPVTQNAEHIRHLSKALRLSDIYMTGMIVFTNPDAMLGNINCNCVYTLDMLYEAIASYNTPIWNKKQTENIILAVEKLNSSSYLMDKEHVKYVQDIQNRHEISRMRKKGVIK